MNFDLVLIERYYQCLVYVCQTDENMRRYYQRHIIWQDQIQTLFQHLEERLCREFNRRHFLGRRFLTIDKSWLLHGRQYFYQQQKVLLKSVYDVGYLCYLQFLELEIYLMDGRLSFEGEDFRLWFDFDSGNVFYANHQTAWRRQREGDSFRFYLLGIRLDCSYSDDARFIRSNVYAWQIRDNTLIVDHYEISATRLLDITTGFQIDYAGANNCAFVINGKKLAINNN